MLNPYLARLIDVQTQEEHDLKEVGDQWRTPDNEFFGIEQFVTGMTGGFVVDLFTDGQNSKCDNYYTALQNALVQDWSGDLARWGEDAGVPAPWAFANPPYSRPVEWDGEACTGMTNIMAKAAAERDKGARLCFLVKSASSETWWPDELSDFPADRIVNIKGRLSFDLPVWCKPKVRKGSAGFGGSLLIFDQNQHIGEGIVPTTSVRRGTLVDIGKPIAQTMVERRKQWIARFADL